MNNDARSNRTDAARVAPPRLGTAIAARNAARRGISSATVAAGILASVGTLGLVGFMGQQAVQTDHVRVERPCHLHHDGCERDRIDRLDAVDRRCSIGFPRHSRTSNLLLGCPVIDQRVELPGPGRHRWLLGRRTARGDTRR